MISNDVYERAWNDADNRGVMRGVLADFRGAFTPEEAEEHMQMALVRCLRRHDPSRGNKFTTSLHNFTQWECLNALRARPPAPIPIGERHEAVSVGREDIDHIYECMSMMDEGDRDLIVRYYLEELSLRELASELGCSYQTVNNRLGRARETLRELCLTR